MSTQQLDVLTPEEVEMRAYVECYSEGKPSTELQYLIFALKIIDELRAFCGSLTSDLVDTGECLRYERQEMTRVIDQVKRETRATVLAESKHQEWDTPT